MSRFMERFYQSHTKNLNAFVLTPAVRICRVRALRERKYQLPSYCHYIDVSNVIVVVAQGPK